MASSLPIPSGTVASVTLDGSGNGIASLGPTRVREHWQLVSASVKASSNVKEAQCSLYVGPSISPSSFISQTATGSSGDTCSLGGNDIQTGMQVWAQWTGGDAGAIATLTPNGSYSLGAPGRGGDSNFNLAGFGNILGFRNPLNITANKVTIIGPHGELLVYDPVAGAGTLIASIVANPFVDPFGNQLLPGIVSYINGAPAIASQMGNGSHNIWTAPTMAGPWTEIMELGSSNLNATDAALFASQGNFFLDIAPNLIVINNANLVAGDPASAGGFTPETWHSLGNIGGGTGMTINRGRYRLTPTGELEIDIQLFCNSAVLTADQTLNWSTALGAQYLPDIDIIAPLGCSSDQNAGHRSNKLLINHTTGVVTITIPPMITPGLYGGTAIIPLI
jgi:hypothetical protein